MGTFTSTLSRRNGGVEVVDILSNNAYKYPPKTGSYFGTHFIMGGERFDMTQPEAYLFGENSDLNYLGNKPVPFPYPSPQGNEPTKTLKSLINIRKDTLRLVRANDAEKTPIEDRSGEADPASSQYNIEFVFDSDVKCSIKIYYLATEEISNGQIVYHSRDPTMNSEVYHYKRGANQLFVQTTHVLKPTKIPEEEWQHSIEKEVIPIVIQCTVEEQDANGHAHMTFANIERSSVDGGFIIKPLKQKQFVDGLCYLLQEIYGIENKHTEKNKDEDDDNDEELEDSGAECVICMSDMRDTLILPCRHLCLCSTCAESLRYQASSCPICRSPFRALLQIRAMRRKPVVTLQQGDPTSEENQASQEGVPLGYEAISLIEALNGPCGLPPLSTMEGIHMPPPFRTEIHSRDKRRVKGHRLTKELVKELMLSSQEEKKVEDEVDKDISMENITLESTGEADIPIPTPDSDKQHTDSLPKASKPKSRHRGKTEKSPELNSPKTEEEDIRERYQIQIVDEVVKGMEDDSEPATLEIVVNSNLDRDKTKYPPLTVSSENLADDEREDTSDGEEEEPEPDYDEDDKDNDSYGVPARVQVVEEDQGVDKYFCPPPNYKSVISVADHCPQSQEIDMDTDEGSTLPLHLSATPSSSQESSGSSTHSSHVLLPQAHLSDEDQQK
ncbi:hypothetical protein CHS0354_013034 [Potamilus streckersoni]|uniref:RING-type E3 ubiquitin transferase n=1 Tax=Potamilus streckersoni TaxID=2493646 RepID=A0AAE0RZU1_9BIVA|nr:hypothetical protein CHS0354_013034 [Potamilus streckersoni]